VGTCQRLKPSNTDCGLGPGGGGIWPGGGGESIVWAWIITDLGNWTKNKPITIAVEITKTKKK